MIWRFAGNVATRVLRGATLECLDAMHDGASCCPHRALPHPPLPISPLPPPTPPQPCVPATAALPATVTKSVSSESNHHSESDTQPATHCNCKSAHIRHDELLLLPSQQPFPASVSAFIKASECTNAVRRRRPSLAYAVSCHFHRGDMSHRLKAQQDVLTVPTAIPARTPTAVWLALCAG
jgi:hypothetical protein